MFLNILKGLFLDLKGNMFYPKRPLELGFYLLHDGRTFTDAVSVYCDVSAERVEARGYGPDMEIVHSLYPVNATDRLRYCLQLHLSRSGFEEDVRRVSDKHVGASHDQDANNGGCERVDSKIASEYHDETANNHG